MSTCRRWPARVCLGYSAATLLAHLTILAGVVIARLVRGDPRVTRSGIRNFRMVDDRLWAGSQPDGGAYRSIVADGVTTVIDLREGTRDDPIVDDPFELAALGIDRVAIPVRDGHAPLPCDVAALLSAVESSSGRVYLHCAAGVGRSTAMQMAYLSSARRPHDVLDQLAVGPPSIEQIAFAASLDRRCDGRVPLSILLISRAVDAPRRALGRLMDSAASL